MISKGGGGGADEGRTITSFKVILEQIDEIGDLHDDVI